MPRDPYIKIDKEAKEQINTKNYSNEKFEAIGKLPLVKVMMNGAVKIPKEDIESRVNAHIGIK
jgi:hypothetical protein